MTGNQRCIIGLVIILVIIIFWIWVVTKLMMKSNQTEIETRTKTTEELEKQGFVTSRIIGRLGGFPPLKTEVRIDTENKQIRIETLDSFVKTLQFSEIMGAEIIEDNSTIASGGVGRAVVGGLIAGGAGAVVGAATRKSKNIVSDFRVIIKTNDIQNPITTLKLIKKETERSSKEFEGLFEFAHELLATLEIIIRQKKY